MSNRLCSPSSEIMFECKFEYDGSLEDVFFNEVKRSLSIQDWIALKNAFYHSTKINLLPGLSSGCDHSFRFRYLLDLLACDSFENIYRLIPPDLHLASNGYPMHVYCTQILQCLMYNKNGGERYDQEMVIAKSERKCSSKSNLWERSIISCLLGIMSRDVVRFNKSIQVAVESFNKTRVPKYRRLNCQHSYGMLVLAKKFLTEDEYSRVKYPEYKTFSKDYVNLIFSEMEDEGELCFEYDGKSEPLNRILKMPAAITRIHQSHFGNDIYSPRVQKLWFLDERRMTKELLESYNRNYS